MPKTTAELVTLLDLEEIEVGLFRGAQPDTEAQRTFGGQVLAQALVAAQRTVGDDRLCHSLNAYFLRPGDPTKPLIYDVETLREGRSFSTRRIVARQGGRNSFAMNASFHVKEPGLDHSDRAPGNVPPPQECRSLTEVMAERFGPESPLWKTWEALDVRFAGDSGPEHSIEARSHSAHMRVWVRTAQPMPDDPGLHQAVLAYLSDMTLLSVITIPHQRQFSRSDVVAASMDHAMWFHRPVRTDEWLLYDMVSPAAASGLGFSTGRLLQDGTMVASCSQEGLVRVGDED
ncbi:MULTISPECIES: acyl-CoA thioesterase [unclassified Luteococcus]|uniref:acyl-CoA thioesterase n=1 Tax=unclassified Luteococcus TaxID=2639923 RepID=UPI00313E4058